jgi:hypothetical protein
VLHRPQNWQDHLLSGQSGPVTYQVIGWRVISNGRALRRLRGPSWPKGALILSTALTQVSEVAAPGDR